MDPKSGPQNWAMICQCGSDCDRCVCCVMGEVCALWKQGAHENFQCFQFAVNIKLLSEMKCNFICPITYKVVTHLAVCIADVLHF